MSIDFPHAADKFPTRRPEPIRGLSSSSRTSNYSIVLEVVLSS